MKIVTWNCQGGFREKFEHIKLLKADIYVIQECTDPEASRGTEYEDYCKFAGEKGKDYYWIGNEPSEEVKSPKGLGIFVKNGLETELINNFYDDFKFFQLIRVKNSYILKNPYKILDNKSNKYLQIVSKLETLSPLLTLKRGYTITKKDNKVINSMKKLKKGDILNVSFNDGNIDTKVI